MAAATTEEWINMFNAKMKKENRKVALSLDDATCHSQTSKSPGP
jgi:hypothetical protein